MLEEVPNVPPFDKNPKGGPQIRDWRQLLRAFNAQLERAPVWLVESEWQYKLVGFPFAALIVSICFLFSANNQQEWPLSTPSGLIAFHHPQVNTAIRALLNEYSSFLNTTASTHVLNSSPHGWLSPSALSNLSSVADPISTPPRPFHELYECSPHEPHYGYKTWDDFFTRRWRNISTLRPVGSPHNDLVISNACESSPLVLAHNVSLESKFWVKGQPYSLQDIFSSRELAESFAGGTIYQAYLSALSYHRWHSPVSGRVKKVKNINGTYYAEHALQGFPGVWNGNGTRALPDVVSPDASQGYIAQTATRAVVVIEADEREKLGEVALVFVGMAEVSTAEVTVREGERVEKGDQLGMFHFGGSTHLQIFEPHVKLEFRDEVYRADRNHTQDNLPVRGFLARVVS
ncbi:phosphatidylserine decarboxylase-domain-containing protein [Sordaria brevicollis]|uniref:Phosphatidylserine decarboxylase-domain-containing protein n=1 Tax=Sordaria brevicollis TaxID=83679 RepID=A0AAE0P332_SORBR|nr:phosphatidylserine decarboxylase-domain-containing protein [Sordaria brevicollis]